MTESVTAFARPTSAFSGGAFAGGVFSGDDEGGGEPGGETQLDAPGFTYNLVDNDGVVSLTFSEVADATSYTLERRSLTSIDGTPGSWSAVGTSVSGSMTDTVPSQWVRYDYRVIATAVGFADSEPSPLISVFWLPTGELASYLVNSSLEANYAYIAVKKITHPSWFQTTHYYSGVGNGASDLGTITEHPTPPAGFTISFFTNNHVSGETYTLKVTRLMPSAVGAYCATNYATYDITYYPPE